jgi:hypothetical protein
MAEFGRKAAIIAGMALIGVLLPAAAPMAADGKPGATAPKKTFTDKRINAFVAAAKGVAAVRQKYAPRFHAAADDDSKKKIVVAARQEMEKVIKDHGLTVAQYNEVLVAAKDDKALADKLGKLLGPPPPKGG